MSFVSYMGTKAALADPIASAFKDLPRGPLLDLFAGMSAVGRSVGSERNVWLNDVQSFSQIVSEFHFLPGEPPLGKAAAVRSALRVSKAHFVRLEEAYAEELKREEEAITCGDDQQLADYEISLRGSVVVKTRGMDELSCGVAGDYDLFSRSYPGTYFGLRQCLELDSLRKGIDHAVPSDDVSNAVLRRWMISALGAAASRSSNSTGHFAQYLTVNTRNAHRVRAQRKRSLLAGWLKQLRSARRIGSEEWRKNNRVYSSDACELLRQLGQVAEVPGVIYADPPYTCDQYSRYYHILETLVLYDYPFLNGKGRYREERFVSSWSLASRVRQSFADLIEASAKLGASLVISYPRDGLLEDSEAELPILLREHYKQVVTLSPVAHKHSTMGASKGRQQHDVVEQLFVAQKA